MTQQRPFFVHYGLELPSTPLLAPEFRNPLFLKTLCRGLNEHGERRLPRGLTGITAIFGLYLGAINHRLASLLDYNPREMLVGRFLEAFAGAIVAKDERWLTIREAEALGSTILPGREFERSLYRGLVSEGVLIEEVLPRESTSHEEIVFVSYERFSDHLVAKILLDTHLTPDDPTSAFAESGGLAFLSKTEHYIAPGLLEAFCIQVPERTKRELLGLAPAVKAHWNIGDAFRQSLVWRAQSGFSGETLQVLNDLITNESDGDDTLDVLLTVATLPDHPLNANFLDEHLRKQTLPERDEFWSLYLHRAWESQGAVDRLVDWAWTLDPARMLETESVELAATALAWVLSSSNRYLRDRATKALVNLLTGRLASASHLVERFADVDDAYVAERVYAVAYGVAMRSSDLAGVGGLAARVYELVFADRTPPAHILLRDYARGVVERALALGAAVDVVPENIRPPYQSTWPHIPTQEEIKPLLPDWSRGSHDSGDPEWAWNRIGSSVLSDDFAHYVIGTNGSSDWLSLRLEDPPWRSTAEQLAELLPSFSDSEKDAWDLLSAADQRLRHLMLVKQLVAIRRTVDRDEAGEEGDGLDEVAGESPHEIKEDDPQTVRAQEGSETLHSRRWK